MTQIEKIKAEIKREINLCNKYSTLNLTESTRIGNNAQLTVLKELLSFIDSLEEPISEDLEEELDKYFSRFKGLERCYWNWRIDSINIHAQGIYDFAKHFAQWQKEQMIEKACKWLSNVSIEDMTYKYNDFDTSEDWYKFIKDFKKVMEE